MKFFLKSKTILGVIISTLPTLLPIAGVSFSPEDGQLLMGGLDYIVQAAGALMAIYGRFTATDKVTLTPKASQLPPNV